MFGIIWILPCLVIQDVDSLMTNADYSFSINGIFMMTQHLERTFDCDASEETAREEFQEIHFGGHVDLKKQSEKPDL